MRQLFSALFVGLLATGAEAQITITAADNVPAIGQTFIYNTTAYAAPPAGGADQLFDFSTLTGTGTATFAWVDTAIYSNGAQFQAQMAMTLGPDTLFYSVTSAGLERMGERNFMNILGNDVDLEIVHANSLLDLALPLTAGNTWVDQVDGTVTADGDTGSRTGVIQGEADGSGTILVPGLTEAAPVLRVKTFLSEVIQIPIGGNPANVQHNRHQYDYYVPWLKMPILTSYMDSMTYFVTVTESGIRWMESDPVGLQEASVIPMEIGLMPNPTEGQLTVNMAVPTGAGAMLFVSDASGRLVASERMASNTQRWQLDTDALATGCYSLTVTDQTGSHGSARFVKR